MPTTDEMRQHADALRALSAEIDRDGLHGLPGTPLPVDHFNRAPRIRAALDKAAELLDEAASYDAPEAA